MKEKISIDQLKEIYGVTERTLNNWIRNKDLPVVQISSQKKWVYKEDLMNWENSFKN
ncbi:helix-turn-helix domain-containing protein [Flavobacteriaceae bacterium]|nr:helix-turn-helix domain-containing protein [Flavobacteriaceae bacterium]